jgi:hypothetical protein
MRILRLWRFLAVLGAAVLLAGAQLPVAPMAATRATEVAAAGEVGEVLELLEKGLGCTLA